MKRVEFSPDFASERVEVALLLLAIVSCHATAVSELSAGEFQGPGSPNYVVRPVSVTDRSGQLAAGAPPRVLPKIAELAAINRTASGTTNSEPLQAIRGLNATVLQPRYVYQLKHIGWCELEFMLARSGQLNVPKAVSPDGVLVTFPLSDYLDGEASLQVNRGSNEVTLWGPDELVRGWMRVLRTVDKPSLPTDIGARFAGTNHADYGKARQAVSQVPVSDERQSTAKAKVAVLLAALHERDTLKVDRLTKMFQSGGGAADGGTAGAATKPLCIDSSNRASRLFDVARQVKPSTLGGNEEATLSNVARDLDTGFTHGTNGDPAAEALRPRPVSATALYRPGPVQTTSYTAEISQLVPLVSFGVGFMCSLAFAAMVLPSVVLRQSRHAIDKHYDRLRAESRNVCACPPASQMRAPRADQVAPMPAGPANVSSGYTRSSSLPSAHFRTRRDPPAREVREDEQQNHGQDSAILERVFEQNLELRGCKMTSPCDLEQHQPSTEAIDQTAQTRTQKG